VKSYLDAPHPSEHHCGVEWVQAATIIGTLTAVIGLQTFWIARSLDAIERRLERFETRFDRIEAREAPGLRRV
jgi:hypothetical protein